MNLNAAQMRAYMADRRARIRAELAALLGGKCTECGDVNGLEFDHIDPETKLFTIASGLDRPRADLLAEVAKCQLLCDLHHQEKTNRESQGVHRAGDGQVRGEQHGQAKTTTDVVRALRASSLSNTEAARQFGMTRTTVRDIRSRRSWKHVA